MNPEQNEAIPQEHFRTEGPPTAPARNTLVVPAPVQKAPASQRCPIKSEMSLSVATAVADLEAIEADWQQLAAEALESNPFYEPWMLLPALRSFGEQARPRVVLVFAPHPSGRKGQRILCGLFPIAQRRSAGLVPVRMIGTWKYPYCYLSTPLVRADCAAAALSMFFDWLAAGGRDTGLVRFEDMPGDGLYHQLFVDEVRRRNWPSLMGDCYTRALFRPQESAERFLENALAGKRRKELRRQHNRLAEQGPLEFTELGPMDDAQPWIKDFMELEAAGWKGREAVAMLSRAADRRYFEEVARHAFLRGKLMMLALRLNGRPIAMKCNLLSGDGSFAFKITYDEQYARFSPGVLLELENILRLHERPQVRWMDSCAAHNRLMINRLWPERRVVQTVLMATDSPAPALFLSLLPLSRWLKKHLPHRKGQEASDAERTAED